MGASPVPVQEPIRFGEFELDLRAYQLRRAGVSLKLERIPMELLLLLVERAGDLVSREQIAAHIWGHGVCLDTDNSINGAIRKIRCVLKDDPEQPRFIETVPGKGYRFIAPVVRPEEPPPPALPQLVPAPPHQGGRLRWPVAVLAGLALVAMLALQWDRLSARSQPAPGKVMLAVLPFDNLTGDPAQEYLSDGLTEELIARLGNLDPQRLGVIARTSVMRYKKDPPPLPQLARELGVQYILEGSVRRDGDQVRITAQFIQLSDETHVWSRQYDRTLSSLLAVQGDIAQAVAEQIHVTLGAPDSATRPPAAASTSPEAYDLYLKGRYFWNKRTPESLSQAIRTFEEAIAREPRYARAHAGLADAYAMASGWNYIPAAEGIARTRAAAERALELDPTLAAPHAALAVVAQNHEWDWKAAEAHYRRAIALDPNYATARHWYAEYLALMGRFDEALAEIERARQLDPQSLIIATDKGAILYFARQYDRAIQQLRAVKEMDPSFPRARGILVSTYLKLQRYDQALAEIGDWDRYGASPYIPAYRAAIHRGAGNRGEAARALRELQRADARGPVTIGALLIAYTGVDDREQVLASLERAYRERSSVLAAIKVEPIYDDLRDDPRFHHLLRRIGFGQ